MTSRYTAIGEAITAIVSELNSAGLAFQVFDMGATSIPSDQTYVIIGGSDPNPLEPDQNVAGMQQEWYGLGLKARREELSIECLAVGRDTTFALARERALGAIESIASVLPDKPSEHTYNTLLDQVEHLEKAASEDGAVVYAFFSITAEARLVP